MGICGAKPKIDDHPDGPTDGPTDDPNGDDANADSDFLFFIEIESDSDEVTLEPIEEGYPEPKPSDDNYRALITKFSFVKKSSKFGGVTDENDNEVLTQEQLDSHARNTPSSAAESFEALLAYLEEPFKDNPHRDIFLVRAILVWLSSQNTSQPSSPGNTNTPSGFLTLLAQKKSTYSTFFTLLCRKGEIKCAQIHGVCKAGDYQPGDKDENQLGCLWNAVYLHDNWHIVHPFWACRAVFGKVSGGWVKLEEGGKTVVKRMVESSGTLQNAFQDYYIMPKPSNFLYRCHPDDIKWELIKNPINRTEFFKRAYLFPPFWKFGLELLSEDRCSMTSENGECLISFRAPFKTANELDMWYELLLKENESESSTELLDPTNLPKLVSLARNTPEWNCRIQFPVKGIYKIVFYAGNYQQQLLRIGEFQLVCNAINEKCQPLPFNPGRLGIGPGPATENAGLLLPTHRNGIIHVDKSRTDKIVVRFFLDHNVSKTLMVKTDLITNKSIKNEKIQKALNESVQWAIENSGKDSNIQTSAKELKITTNIRKEEDYYLRISTGHRQSGSEVVGDDNMSIVCNYHLTTSKYPSYENGTKRYARRNLLTAMEGDNVDTIEKWVKSCESAGIKQDDPDIQYARRKIEVLRLRTVIHEAWLRRNAENTRALIQQIKTSDYLNIFRHDVQNLERFLVKLQSMHGFTQELPWLLDALLELCNRQVPNDVVQNVLLALLTLFGEEINHDEEFEFIQVYARKLYGKIITQKEANFKECNARRAQSVLDRFTYEETQYSTMAATKMYNRINDVIKTILQGPDDDKQLE